MYFILKQPATHVATLPHIEQAVSYMREEVGPDAYVVNDDGVEMARTLGPRAGEVFERMVLAYRRGAQ